MAKLDDLIQQKQQRDEDWKAKKTAEREELRQLSDDAVMRVTSEPNAYLRYLDTQAINPQYSAANVMLAMAQNPDITYINSLENWGRLGRSVNREETGLKIRVSDPYVKDGRQYHGYKIGRVFDVTQTHGKAVPAPLTLRDNTPEMEAALSRLLDSAGVPVVTDAAMYQDAFYDPKAQRITVSTRLSDSKTFAALAREIVHAGIHDRGRYPYYSREDCAMDLGLCAQGGPHLYRNLQHFCQCTHHDLYDAYRAVYRPELLGHVRKHYLLPLDVYGKKCEEPRLYLP